MVKVKLSFILDPGSVDPQYKHPLNFSNRNEDLERRKKKEEKARILEDIYQIFPEVEESMFLIVDSFFNNIEVNEDFDINNFHQEFNENDSFVDNDENKEFNKIINNIIDCYQYKY